MLSVNDIATTKADTIGRRGSYRDYVDLYFILSEGHATLMDIVSGALRKFGQNFNAALFLQQLVYLDDVKDRQIQFLKTLITPEKLLAFFEDQIRQSVDDLI